jgi:hypothetical protein
MWFETDIQGNTRSNDDLKINPRVLSKEVQVVVEVVQVPACMEGKKLRTGGCSGKASVRGGSRCSC